MELTKQVCSLELAKRFYNLGVKQESLFYWKCAMPASVEVWLIEIGKEDYGWNVYSAFTVAELGEMFPKNIEWHSTTGFTESAWSCTMTKPDGFERTFGETEADARASMLIYLLENKLITP